MSWLYVKNPVRWTGSKETKARWEQNHPDTRTAADRVPLSCKQCGIAFRFRRQARAHGELLGHEVE